MVMSKNSDSIQSVSLRRAALESRYPVWERRTIATHFFLQCKTFQDRPYILVEDASFSYQETWENAWKFAKALLKLGVKRRQHVALLMDNEPSIFMLMLAITLIGAACVPLNTMLRRDELDYILRQSDADLLIMHQNINNVNHEQAVLDILNTMDKQLSENPRRLKQVVCIPKQTEQLPDKFLHYDTFLSGADEITDDEVSARWHQSEYPDETAYIIYTSGSTGTPKGAIITHDMFLRCAYSTCLSRAFADGRRIFTSLPFYHVFALEEGLLAASFVGGAVITMSSFSPQRSLQLMEKFQANDFLCVPSTLVAILSSPAVKTVDLSSLTALMCAAAPAPVPVWEQAVSVLKVSEICTGYGGTEVTASTVHTEVGDPIETVVTSVGRIKPAGSTGLPEYNGANVQYKVVNPYTGEELPNGEIGELVVRGNIVTRGYYNKPDETAAVIDKDGWFKTGDLGSINQNGYLEFHGRSKDMYKVSGENVAPKEVEEVISKHPALNQVYVVGVTDTLTIEAGAAFIELKPGQSCTRSDIVRWCQESLARFKVPRHVWFVSANEWPLTGTGKIQKFRLKDMAIERLERAR